ncbi:MAG: alpha/beta hydrolase, partial [Paracoccaceae bacterium]|nr:alpha/beta hydrolase [Paracoccaceae bacterium]
MPKFTTSDGLNLFYTDEGQGLPVLALAGLTRNGKDFDHVAPHLNGVRLIRLDYRGRGQSDWAKDWTTYSIPVEGRDAVELLDHLGIEKAAILGTSRGGLIAMVLAATVKNRLLGIALNDIGPEIEDVGLDIIKQYIGRNPVWKTHAEAARKYAAGAKGFSNVSDKRWRTEVETLYNETPEGLTINYDPKLRDAVLASAEGLAPDLWPLFDMMNGLPLACIRGANSDLLSKVTLNEMQKRRPDMIAVNVPDRA